MNVILFSSRIQSFSQSEILNMLDRKLIEDIKKTDPHPFFQAYSICHPGSSNPKLLDETEVLPVHWPKKAVQSLKNLVLKGLKLFKGHNKDNSIENRGGELGEVIANVEKEINGELNHIVITYHKPEQIEEAKKYDICSQEGEWNFIKSAGQLIADSVEKITSIALGKSNEDIPAFSGARKLGMIQCFVDKLPDGDNGADAPKENKMEITFKDVLDFIQSRNIIPSRIYKLEDLKSDKEFVKEFKIIEDKEEQIKALTDKVTLLEKENAKNSVYDRFNKMLEETKPTENIKTFLTNSFKEDLAEMEDLKDDTIKKYIGLQTKAFQRINREKQPDNIEFNKDNPSNNKDYFKKENNPSLSEDVDLSEFQTLGGK